MERGLLWLPLLGIFFWLAWSGWNEYRKVEAYKVWAEDFDNAKFDIYSVLGKKEQQVTWGKPTRQGMVDLQSFSLGNVQEINLLIDDRIYDVASSKVFSNQDNTSEFDNLPTKGKPSLSFSLDNQPVVQIPFTDISLAAKWRDYLLKATTK